MGQGILQILLMMDDIGYRTMGGNAWMGAGRFHTNFLKNLYHLTKALDTVFGGRVGGKQTGNRLGM